MPQLSSYTVETPTSAAKIPFINASNQVRQATVTGLTGLVAGIEAVDPLGAAGVPLFNSAGRAIHYRQTTATPTYTGGFLSAASGTGTRAWYAETPMPSGCTRLGAEFKFTAGSTRGASVVLILWETSLSADPGIPRTPVHAVFTRWGWTVGAISTVGGNVVNYATGKYKTILAANTLLKAEVAVEDGVLSILLPDGDTVTAANAALSSVVGYFPCVEFFQFAAQTDDTPAIGKWWASSGSQKVRGNGAGALASLNVYGQPSAVTIKSISASTTINTSATLLDVAAVCPVYPGKRSSLVLCRAQVWCAPASQNIFFQFRFYDSDNTLIYSDFMYSGLISSPYGGYYVVEYVQNLVSSLPLTCQLWISASGTGATVAVDAGRPVTMSFLPLG